jgi:predicted protein tyrosine phosphatase
MPAIAVCSLALVPDRIQSLRPWGLITLLSPGSMIDTPAGLGSGGHLQIETHDIPDPAEGLTAPQARHVEDILGFISDWDQGEPLLVHCWAGVSRSTATAFIAACALNPETPETHIAAAMRRLSPTASPNPLLVRHGDWLLGRGGRMEAAVAAIGTGEMCWEGTPFELPSSWPSGGGEAP